MKAPVVALALFALGGGCAPHYFVHPQHLRLSRERLADGRRLVIPAVTDDGRETFVDTAHVQEVVGRSDDRVEVIASDPKWREGIVVGVVAGFPYGALFLYEGLAFDDHVPLWSPEAEVVLGSVCIAAGIMGVIALALDRSAEAPRPSPGIPGTIREAAPLR